MPLKASYLVLVGAGAIVAVAGFKGWGVGQAFRDVISGKSPKTNQQGAQTSNAILAASYASPGGGYITQGSSGISGSANNASYSGPVGPGENGFFTAVLAAIGAPPTSADLTSLHNWRLRESPWNSQPPDGAQFTWNPLNTTLRTHAVTGEVNSIGVRIYANAVAGVAATAATLLGGYPAIVSALRRGVGLNTGDPAVAAELSTWSGGGYSSV